MSNHQTEIKEYPILTVKNIVLFPNTTRPLYFNRKQSIEALERAVSFDQRVFITTLKSTEVQSLKKEDLYEVGVLGKVLKLQQLPNGTVQALIQTESRGKLVSSDLSGSDFKGRVATLETRESATEELPQLVGALKKEFFKNLDLLSEGRNLHINGNLDFHDLPAGQFADALTPFLEASLEEQQQVLETLDTRERLEKVYLLLLKAVGHRQFEQNLKKKVEEKLGKKQKEFYLNEQLKAIQEEIGGDSERNEIQELSKKIEEAGMPPKVKKVAVAELNKLKTVGDQSHEAAPLRNYLDWLVSVPWNKESEDNLSLENVQSILDEDHYGMDKVKERIVEHIAVGQATGKLGGSILLLTGPPGVGKTSLAKSIAKALGREFGRISLGGIRDEAEIRGHRRTYIGALPGKLIQTMKKVGTINPVILLDEIDKVAQYYSGGPTAALLEVLDPEQNNQFMDHYLEVEYDLSQVLFITTANNLSTIPLPLQDRLEIIELSGYTELEKTQIAKKYLIPKQKIKNGVKEEQLKIDENQILNIIRSYTREAGVRTLERTLAKISRKGITEILSKNLKATLVLDEDKILSYLGTPIFEYNKIEEHNEVGMVTGLAWTSVGGETLSIEVSTMKGHGKVQLTGKLGDVMKESAQAAISYVRSNANAYGIYSKVFDTVDIHIHVPAGGTPKDGPSAGIALASAVVSALTGIPVHRQIALTGEITLRGKVLPIGGLKEKLLAAKRALIKKVLIPEGNQKDLHDIPEEIKSGLDIQTVKNAKEVIPVLLEKVPIAVNDSDLDREAGNSDSEKELYKMEYDQNPISGIPSKLLES